MAKKKNAAAVALSAQRMKKMTPEQRSDVARKAINARWAKRDAAKA